MCAVAYLKVVNRDLSGWPMSHQYLLNPCLIIDCDHLLMCLQSLFLFISKLWNQFATEKINNNDA